MCWKVQNILKKEQFESVYQFYRDKDIFASLPTGNFKSVIYAMLPFIFNHIRGKAFKYGTEQVLLQDEDGRILICISIFCSARMS